jgi:hypothetical protein
VLLLRRPVALRIDADGIFIGGAAGRLAAELISGIPAELLEASSPISQLAVDQAALRVAIAAYAPGILVHDLRS